MGAVEVIRIPKLLIMLGTVPILRPTHVCRRWCLEKLLAAMVSVIGGYSRDEAAGMLMVTIADWSDVKMCKYEDCALLNSFGTVNQKAVSVCA